MLKANLDLLGRVSVQLMSKHPGVQIGPFEIRPVADLSEMIHQSKQRRAKAKRQGT